ncbi:SIP domain-containing protein, partial [Cutibacterium acnes]
VTSEDEVEPGLATRWETSVRSLRIIHTQPRQEADAVVAALRADYARAPRPGYVWVSGEGELAKSVRGLAVNEWGLDTTAVTWVPYWFYGRARP